ncbi:hypothetical protein [Nannocystis bainbridge]|uniref:Uncharacterized protein n=1 Tax=Nannocystis bainbridge TaxID=2995303 RepID=A0ABT5E8P2_9BACT|nr:hypothetical protein [Nannocystis bainbridge]MDC0721202.1 hypothetical protein [Nannocystis bainbridge]
MLPDLATLEAAASANNSLNNLPNQLTGRQRARRELTVAAFAGYMADHLGLAEDHVAHCVAGGFVPDQDSQDCWPQAVVGGLRAAPGAGDIPQVRAGAAPIDLGERYILLTGDANFDVIPSCAAVQPPVIVGLGAMHHGSFIETGVYLDRVRIPWAPGSAAAVAAHHAHLANLALERTITIACAAAHGNAAPPGATVTLADHVAAAAAAAIVAADAAGHGGDILFDAQTADLIALSTAAAAYAAARGVAAGTGARAVAVSMLIVFGLTKTSPPPLPLAAVYTAATNLLAAAGGGGVNGPRVAQETRGCVGQAGGINYAATVAAGVMQVAGLADALNTANAAAAAVAAVTHGMPATYLPYAAVAGAIAGAAVLGVGAAAGVGAEATAAGVPLRAAEVTTALTHRPAAGFAAQPNLATCLVHAARWTAEGVAAWTAGADAEAVTLGVDAVLAGTGAHASAVHGLPAGSRIAYSYGVTATGKHAYRSDNLASYGHAHPPAIALYEAKGWTARRNVCARAAANVVHAGHHDQHDAVSPAGHVALCWDAANDAQVVAGVINYVCPDCGAAIDFNV